MTEKSVFVIVTPPLPSMPLTKIVIGSSGVGEIGEIETLVMLALAQSGHKTRTVKRIFTNFFSVTLPP